MVLLITDNIAVDKCPTDLEQFLLSSSRISQEVDVFCKKERIELNEKDDLINVMQHEYAISHPNDVNVEYLGSEDATTCHVVVIRDPITGITSLIHWDSTDEGGKILKRIVKKIFKLADKLFDNKITDRILEINLVGGYEDERNNSKELTIDLIQNLITSEYKFLLGLCCVGHLNTHYENVDETALPIHYGCAVNIKSGEISPISKLSYGPERILRNIRCTFNKDRINSNKLEEAYNCESGTMMIHPFEFNYFPALEMLCRAPSSCILEVMSTSPNAEPENFVSTIKSVMQFVIDNPNPAETVWKDGYSIVYKKSKAGWSRQC